MIYDLLSNAWQYSHLGPGVEKGLNFLANTDFSGISDGRYDIEGKDLKLVLSHYDTRLETEAQAESHLKYIDIQYLLEGRELVSCGFLSEMTECLERIPERDIYFHKGPLTPFPLGSGRFMILFPHDIHATGIMLKSPEKVRKAIIKVKIPE